jgi:8-oxo-dGTP pyrophosphatase MutT (NUDIX family)
MAARHLLDDLSAYAPLGAADHDALTRVLELLSRRVDPFTRELPEHVTASAVVARADGSSFLLVHHRKLARWLQPGGHVEPEDATVFDAARREAREETGVTELHAPFGARVLDVDVHPIPPRVDRPAHVHYDVRYLLTTSQIDLLASEEAHAARWFTLEETRSSGADESLARALLKAHAWLTTRTAGDVKD